MKFVAMYVDVGDGSWNWAVKSCEKLSKPPCENKTNMVHYWR